MKYIEKIKNESHTRLYISAMNILKTLELNFENDDISENNINRFIEFLKSYPVDLMVGIMKDIKSSYPESYKRAYGCNNDATARTEGSKNLAKPNIKNYIDERMKEIEDKRIAKAEEVLEYLTKVIRNEEKEEVVVTVNVGDFQTEIKKVKKELSAKDKIKAAELLGKRYRLFTDKVEADVNQVVVFTGEDDLED